MAKQATTRNVRIFRYDPCSGGEGHFDNFVLNIPDETTTTFLDVLLRLQREQDPSLAFRFACRVNMCGSCAMVINGKEALACKTNVSDFAAGKELTIRPLNHFPVIKDLVVDLDPLFQKFEETLPFYEPKDDSPEPAVIRPDSPERQAIGQATECIACGCCVSSCTMVHYHGEYAGPAALNRAFTLLADSRDGLFEPRLTRALASCYDCRTEVNCTEVCPKEISSTRAIKYIQRLALKQLVAPGQFKGSAANSLQSQQGRARSPLRAGPAQGHLDSGSALAIDGAQGTARPTSSGSGPKGLKQSVPIDRAAFLRQLGVGLLGAGSVVALGGLAAVTALGPNSGEAASRWVPLAKLSELPLGVMTTVLLKYEAQSGIYTQSLSTPVLVSRLGTEIVCYKSSCPHLGCLVHWDGKSDQFRCACHGGTFDHSGKVLAGPPPRPLDRYQVKVEAEQLLVLV